MAQQDLALETTLAKIAFPGHYQNVRVPPHATYSTDFIELPLARKALLAASQQQQAHHAKPTTTAVMPKATDRSEL